MVYTVKIEPPPDEEKRYADEQRFRTEQLSTAREQLDVSRNLNLISAVAGAIAFLALVGFLYYAYLVRESNKIAKTASDIAYSPYIGIDHILVRFSRWGSSATTDMPTAETDTLNVTTQIKNFGPVPGLNYASNWKMFYRNKEVPQMSKVPDKPFILFPGQVMSLGATIYGEEYRAVSKAETALSIEVTITYDAPTGPRKECEKAQYLPDVGRFARLGPCLTH